MSDMREQIRVAAEEDLETFIKLVAPHRVLGDCHTELLSWWTREDHGDHQLALMPRDHQKSAMIAYRVAWTIVKNPSVTILYISATSTLAEKQLKFIGDILESKIVRTYWPKLVNEREGKREKWTTSELCVDHPQRKEDGVRDSTVFTAGLTTSITGLHFEIAVLDDVVVKENAYTNEGRDKVAGQYSLLSSIESTGTDEDATGAEEWVVGTRYHPKDLYNTLITMEYEEFNSSGEQVDSHEVYEVWQKEVEDHGDGTGDFLWPRQVNNKNKWFGFDITILAKKRAKYIDKTQYRSQYYNNPNDPDNAPIERSKFQYYDKRLLQEENGYWYYKDQRLNVFAAIDFAFSLRTKADSSAVVVIGVTSENDILILDIDRFKTDKISKYFEHILAGYYKWGFKKLRAEITVAQQSIVRELKEQYIKSSGLPIKVDEYRPSRHEGNKQERISATLEPRYDNLSIWHAKGGNTELLEEELVMAHPAHDDIKDALAAAIDIAVAPRQSGRMAGKKTNIVYSNRFGGVAYKQG
jgi:hypothetical protein